MRGCGNTSGLDIDHSVKGKVACRASGAESHRKKIRIELGQFAMNNLQIGYAFLCFRRIKLETEKPGMRFL
jgi:hypothetical protein